MKARAILLYPAWHVTRSLGQNDRTVHNTHPPISHLAATWVMGLTVMVSHPHNFYPDILVSPFYFITVVNVLLSTVHKLS